MKQHRKGNKLIFQLQRLEQMSGVNEYLYVAHLVVLICKKPINVTVE